MELALFVYLASVLPSVKAFLGAVSTGVLMLLVLCFMWQGLNGETFKPKRVFLITPIVILVIIPCISSERAMYMMAAAYGSQKVIESPTADKVVTLINSKLDEYIKDIETNVKEKSK